MLFINRSNAETSLGQFESAQSDAEQALRLEPRGPLAGLEHQALGSAELGLGRFDAAMGEYNKAIDLGHRDSTTYALEAAAGALAGKTDAAKSALAEARKLNPNLTVNWAAAHGWKPPGLDGLRKAGLAEE